MNNWSEMDTGAKVMRLKFRADAASGCGERDMRANSRIITSAYMRPRAMHVDAPLNE